MPRTLTPEEERRWQLNHTLRSLEARCRVEAERYDLAAVQGYYLFESYEDVPDNWPEDPEHPHVDATDSFCRKCADRRIEQMRAVGIKIAEGWWSHRDEGYHGPYEDSSESDHIRRCADCYRTLDCSLTSYAVKEEIAHWRMYDTKYGPLTQHDVADAEFLAAGAQYGDMDAMREAIACTQHVLDTFVVSAGDEMQRRSRRAIGGLVSIGAAIAELATGRLARWLGPDDE